ncbi:phosphatidate cytidylyltransferase [Schumannella sp. 10F1B-5-1]|uniref:phosphatidate cytidylyltransferase n=1 Tax=Schumannella sp. 10F1B-5-1 TaxID=2590780 RepID=UPI001132227B|nr:phosphatidate cytidylyltransferase [Schumannella sp. 10F1B-5-1]TPW72368.1 phosphatidate cytidylyltransferase [Schumannella sp. 10F1B-5-1]
MTDDDHHGHSDPEHKRHTRAEFEAKARANVAEFEAQVRATRAQFEEANARIEARAGRNLPFAIGVGILLGGLLIVSLVILKWLFIVFGAVLVAFTIFELASALRFAGRDVPRVASVVVGVAVMPAAFFLGVEGLWLATLAAIAIISLYRLIELASPRGRAPAREVILDLVSGAFIQLYVTFLAGFLVVLTSEENGQFWTLTSIIVVVGADIGAYLFGVLWGKNLMAPKISPKKTWEGFGGAAVFAIGTAVLCSWLMLGQPFWLGIPLGILLLLTGTGGDLVESLIKRDLGIKDISSWLPGHGGFLDRLDSILPSAAIAYGVYLVATQLGG